MQRWAIAILFSALLTCPAVSALADGAINSQFSFPTLTIPIGSDSHPSIDMGKKADEEEKMKEKKEKELRDKKIDDAIKKGWEEK